MPLPVLQVQQADLIRHFHRVDAAWAGHFSDGELLSCGTAYANRDFPNVPDANNVRDAALHGDLTAAQAVAEVEAHFAATSTKCAYWSMNPSAPEAQTRPLIEYLLAHGYRTQHEDILYLRNAIEQQRTAPQLKIIPARASYKHTRMLATEVFAPHATRDQWVEAFLRHLDDPHFEAILAMKDDRPVGYVGVLSVGDLAEVQEVYVSPDFRRQGVGQTLMNRVLEICARALFKHVFVLVESDNGAAQALYAGCGFSKTGAFTTYRAHPRP